MTAPAKTAERREQTLEHLRDTVPANAARGAEAITAAVGRLGMVDLLRAAVIVAELESLAAEDKDAGESETG
jgi:hypothetical protein